MARYIVTTGSNFKPFTYDEVVKPLQQMADAQNAAQDMYDTLGMETAALRHYISENEGDLKAKKLYDDYVAKLDALQNNLWENGYNSATRRDLSVARDGYFGDITRLSNAIKARQERSKAYWDMKHNHPDLIMGEDPGTAGLDAYLDDANYGQNYYSYSGDSFMKEVAADAQARANEMLQDIDKYVDVARHPELKGMLITIVKNGYNSEHVRNATAAVRAALSPGGNRDNLKNLPLEESILANVLLSHLDSTGAQGNVSADEFGRLINFGEAGLSSVIGQPKVQFQKDSEYEYQQQLRLMRAKKAMENPAPSASPTAQRGYFWNGFLQNLTSQEYTKAQHLLKGTSPTYANGAVMINNPTGTADAIHSEWEMTDKMYNTDLRKRIRAATGGLDIALTDKDFDGKRQVGITKDEQGHSHETSVFRANASQKTALANSELSEKYGLKLDDIQFVLTYKDDSGRELVNTKATCQYNAAIKEYNKNIQNYKNANPTISDWSKYALDPKQEYKLRKEFGIGNDVDTHDIGAIVYTRATQGEFTPAMFASSDTYYDTVRENAAGSLATSFAHHVNEAGGKLDPGSVYAIYSVGKDGHSLSKKGETDLANVLGTGSGENKDKINTKNITSISIPIRNLYDAANSGRAQVQFTSAKHKGSLWSADSSMFGMLGEVLADKYMHQQFSWADIVRNTGIQPPRQATPYGFSPIDMVNFLMRPLMEPETVLRMSDEQSDNWAIYMYSMLNDLNGDVNSAADIHGPSYGMRPVSAKDIVYDRTLQSQLRQAITEYVNNTISVARELPNQQPFQTVTATSTSPATLLGGKPEKKKK